MGIDKLDNLLMKRNNYYRVFNLFQYRRNQETAPYYLTEITIYLTYLLTHDDDQTEEVIR